MKEGWVKVHRKICLNGLWKKPMDFRLFFYLLVYAVFGDEVKYDDVIVKRGQYLRSYRQLQEDLTYIQNNRVIIPSLSSLKRSIEHLVQLKMIATLETKLGTLFTVVNYEKYQSENDYLIEDKHKLGTKPGTEHGTAPVHQENNNNNANKEKNEEDHDQGFLKNSSREASQGLKVTDHYKAEDIQIYFNRSVNGKDLNQFNFLASKHGKDVCDKVLALRVKRKKDGSLSKVYTTRIIFGETEVETNEIFENAKKELQYQESIEEAIKLKKEEKSKSDIPKEIKEIINPVVNQMDQNLCDNGCGKKINNFSSDGKGHKFCSHKCYCEFVEKEKVKKRKAEEEPLPV